MNDLMLYFISIITAIVLVIFKYEYPKEQQKLTLNGKPQDQRNSTNHNTTHTEIMVGQ